MSALMNFALIVARFRFGGCLMTSLAVIFILLAIWRWRIQKRNAVPGVSYMVVVAIVALALVYQGSLGGLMVFGK